jgi:hypothetical protein
LPRLIHRNCAQVTYHPGEVRWKIRIVDRNHVRVTDICTAGGWLIGVRELLGWISAGARRISNGVESGAGGSERRCLGEIRVKHRIGVDNGSGGGIEGQSRGLDFIARTGSRQGNFLSRVGRVLRATLVVSANRQGGRGDRCGVDD